VAAGSRQLKAPAQIDLQVSELDFFVIAIIFGVRLSRQFDCSSLFVGHCALPDSAFLETLCHCRNSWFLALPGMELFCLTVPFLSYVLAVPGLHDDLCFPLDPLSSTLSSVYERGPILDKPLRWG